MNGAIYKSNSGNKKIKGSKKIDATYTSIKSSCPKSCPLMGNGCYGELSFVGIVSKRLDKEATNLSALEVARSEARAIDLSYKGKKVPSGRDLRLRVAGDSRTIKGTKLINSAVGRWQKRGGNDCWAYTHAWQNVSRHYWNNVSILASVSSTKEVQAARDNGYAPAIVVDHFITDKAYILEGSDTKWIPCPAQTKGVGCSDCRLCFNADRLYAENMGIAFAAHGVRKEKIKLHLKVIQ